MINYFPYKFNKPNREHCIMPNEIISLFWCSWISDFILLNVIIRSNNRAVRIFK